MIVVNPAYQGMGIGGQLMRELVDRIGNFPSFLECTNASNVPFYEKFGYQVVREAVLRSSDESSSATLYYMVRDVGLKH